MNTTTTNLFLTIIFKYVLRKRDTSQWIGAEKKGCLSMNDSGEIGHTQRKDLEKIQDLYLIFCLEFDSKDFNGSPNTEYIWKIHWNICKINDFIQKYH